MASRRTIALRAALPILLVGGLLLLTGERPPFSTEPSRPEGGPGAATGPDPMPGAIGAHAGGVIEGLVLRRGRGVEARVEARVGDGLDRGPVAGATVAGADGRPFRGLVRGTAWTETSAEGRFRIRGLDPGVHPLVFLLPGVFRSVGHAVAVPTDRDFVFVVDEGAVVFAGRVVDAESGAPIPDVLVGSRGGRRAEFAVTVAHRVRTDAEGRFRVRVVPTTYRGLTLRAEGYRPCRYGGPWESEEVEIALDRAHRATGRVETEEGQPVAGVAVFAEPAGWNYHGAPAPARAVSGGDGRFVLEGISGDDVIVFARGGGFVSRGLAAALGGSRNPLRRTLGRETSAGIRVVVVPCAAIEGRVVDPNGRPVAGALVRGLPPVKGADFEIPARNLKCRTATAPDGRFRLEDLLPDAAYELRATAPGHLPATARVPPVPSGETAEAEIVLALGPSGPPEETVVQEIAPGLTIGGRVLLADGTPVPHGRLTTRPRHSSPIGAGGAFLVPGHAPGRYRVEAEALVDDRRHVGAVEVEAGDVEVEIVLAPEPERERHGPGFEVRILDPEGRPVPWADLVCVDLGDLSNDYGWSGTLVHLGRTRIDLDAGGKRFWLHVRDARSHSNAPLPVGPVLVGPIEAGEAKIEIRLPPEREIRGIVLDEHGRAVPGARVYCVALRNLGSAFWDRDSSVYTDDEGRFRIGRLGDGDHRLSASLGDLGPAFAIVRSGAGDALLVLRRSVSAVVRVVEARGHAVSGSRWRFAADRERESSRRALGGGPASPACAPIRATPSSCRRRRRSIPGPRATRQSACRSCCGSRAGPWTPPANRRGMSKSGVFPRVGDGAIRPPGRTGASPSPAFRPGPSGSSPFRTR